VIETTLLIGMTRRIGDCGINSEQIKHWDSQSGVLPGSSRTEQRPARRPSVQSRTDLVQRTGLIALFVFVFVLFGLAVRAAHYPGGKEIYCEYSESSQKNCATHDATLILIWKAGKFLDDHNGAIIAIFTIVLSAFTVGLYWETAGLRRAADLQKEDTREALDIARESADAATLSARASMGVELPRFVLDSIFVLGRDDLRGTLKDCRPVIHVTNHGRTSGEIICDGVDFLVGDLPARPPNFTVYSARLGTIVGPGKSHVIDRVIPTPLTVDEIERIVSGSVNLWLNCRLWYRDFMNDVHIKRFCCRATTRPAMRVEDGTVMAVVAFVAAGPPGYNDEGPGT